MSSLAKQQMLFFGQLSVVWASAMYLILLEILNPLVVLGDEVSVLVPPPLPGVTPALPGIIKESL